MVGWLTRFVNFSLDLHPKPTYPIIMSTPYLHPSLTLDQRIAARVAREKANGTYDFVEPMKRDPQRSPAVKVNGGIRGSTATRWNR